MKTLYSMLGWVDKAVENAKIQAKKGDEYYRIGDFENAKAAYAEAIRLHPNESEYHNFYGLTVDKLKDYESAKEAFEKAIQLNPTHPKYYLHLGDCYQKLNNHPLAIITLNKTNQMICPNRDLIASILRFRAYSNFCLKNYKDAIEDYSESIKLNPNFADSYFLRGRAYRDQNEMAKDKAIYLKAIADFSQAILLDNTRSSYYSFRGVTSHLLGDSYSAIPDLDKAIEMNNRQSKFKPSLDNHQWRLEAYKKLGDSFKIEKEKKQLQKLILRESTPAKLYMAIQNDQSGLVMSYLKTLREENTGLLHTFNLQTDEEEPVICSLARAGRANLVKPCVNYIRLDTKDTVGNHALHIAAMGGHIAFCDAIISEGVLERNSEGQYQWPINNLGQTPFHIAALNGHVKFIQHLTNHYHAELELTKPDVNGDTIIHLIVRSSRPSAVVELMQLYPNLSCRKQNNAKQDIVMLAIASGKVDLLEHVLSLPVDLANRNEHGQTALHLATQAEVNALEMVKLLVEKRASLSALDKAGVTPISYVNENSQIGIYFANLKRKPLQHFVIKKPSYRNLVFQGGGVKGLVYSSALRTAIENHVINLNEIERVGGSSAGAITALLVGLGFNLDEIDHLIGITKLEKFDLPQVKFTELLDGEFGEKLLAIKNKDLKNPTLQRIQGIDGVLVGLARLFDGTALDAMRLAKDGAEMVAKIYSELNKDFGLCPGIRLRTLFSDLIKAKLSEKLGYEISDEVTFKELHDHGFKQMYFVGINIENGAQQIFSFEHTPNMIVADAVRISMSIPGVFKPHPMVTKEKEGTLKRSKTLYVDGGVLWNYPIELFDFARYGQGQNALSASLQQGLFNEETLGFRLASTNLKAQYENIKISQNIKTLKDEASVNNIWKFVMQLATAIIDKEESDHKRQSNQFRTIYIDPLTVGTMDFDKAEDPATKLLLNQQGREGVLAFMKRMQTKPTYQVTLPDELGDIILKYCKIDLHLHKPNGQQNLQVHIKPYAPAVVVDFYNHPDPKVHRFLHDCLAVPLWERDETENTPFHIAARDGKAYALRRLLAADPDGIHALNVHKQTPRDLAKDATIISIVDSHRILMSKPSSASSAKNSLTIAYSTSTSTASAYSAISSISAVDVKSAIDAKYDGSPQSLKNHTAASAAFK